MGPRGVCKSSLILSGLLFAACTRSSPAAPAALPAPAPAITAAAIFLTPNTWDLPAGGGALDLTIATAASTTGNAIAPNIVVTLSASSGTLSDTAPQTDYTGHAKVTWTGASSATITARAGDVATTATIRVAPTTPAPPIPTPSPGPAPAPTPGPPPPGRLIVDLFPTPRGTDASTPVTFTARVRAADGSAVGSLSYAWDFNEDGITDSTEASPTYLFPPRDHWDVTLLVTAADGRTGIGTIAIVVGASPAPLVQTALTINPSTVLVGDPVTLTATASSNVTAGPIVAFDWNFDVSKPGVDLTTTTGSTTTSYTTAGVRKVSVTARTANGSTGTGTGVVTVNDPPPPPLTVGLSVTPTGPQPTGTTFSITAKVTSAGPVPGGLVFEWDYTNHGTIDETTIGSPSSTVGHVYNTSGTKTLKVSVTAPDGRSTSNTITIVVS